MLRLTDPVPIDVPAKSYCCAGWAQVQQHGRMGLLCQILQLEVSGDSPTAVPELYPVLVRHCLARGPSFCWHLLPAHLFGQSADAVSSMEPKHNNR